MCQERLGNFSLIANKKELSEENNLDDIIDCFASKNARKMNFKFNTLFSGITIINVF